MTPKERLQKLGLAAPLERTRKLTVPINADLVVQLRILCDVCEISRAHLIELLLIRFFSDLKK